MSDMCYQQCKKYKQQFHLSARFEYQTFQQRTACKMTGLCLLDMSQERKWYNQQCLRSWFRLHNSQLRKQSKP